MIKGYSGCVSADLVTFRTFGRWVNAHVTLVS